MKDALTENGNEYTFSFTDAFELTINNVPENVPENRLKKIVELIKKDKYISMLSIANKINVTHKTVKRDITKLKDMGTLKRIGSAKGGYWQITENNK